MLRSWWAVEGFKAYWVKMDVGKKIVIGDIIKGASVKYTIHKRWSNCREDSASDGAAEEVRRARQPVKYEEAKHWVDRKQDRGAIRGWDAKKKGERIRWLGKGK